MNEKEFNLLKLAAKAIDLEIRQEPDGKIAAFKYDRCWIFWNPLQSMEDALKLACDLGMDIDLSWNDRIYVTFFKNAHAYSLIQVFDLKDKYESAKIAITKAAAQLGEVKKESSRGFTDE